MIIEGYFFLFLIETICCDPSCEQFKDGSDEGPQHMFLCRTDKNYPLLSPNTPSYLGLCKTLNFQIYCMQKHWHCLQKLLTTTAFFRL